MPIEIGDLAPLVSLNLAANNQFSGNIPDEVGNLSALALFDVRNNALTGALPTGIGSLSMLNTLRLDANGFQGAIPVAWQSLAPTEFSARWNGLLLGTVMDPFAQVWADSASAATQTIAPAITNAVVGTGTVDVGWTPIAYQSDSGYYEIGIATAAEGPFAVTIAAGGGIAHTADKSVSSLSIQLNQTGTFFIAVRTVTNAHGNNSNAITSAWSAAQQVDVVIDPPPQADPYLNEIDFRTAAIEIFNPGEEARDISGFVLRADGLEYGLSNLTIRSGSLNLLGNGYVVLELPSEALAATGGDFALYRQFDEILETETGGVRLRGR